MLLRPRRYGLADDPPRPRPLQLLPGIIASGGAGGGGGGLDPNTVSLMHFDGADGSTVFTDEAGIVWTVGGNSQLDTAQAKFGPSSYLNDGSGDYLAATDPVFAPGSAGDFTAECYFRLQVFAGNHFAFAFGAGWGVYALTFNNGFALFDGGSSNAIIGFNGGTVINTWYHVALVRASGVFNLWINGASIGTAANSTNFNAGNVVIGGHTSGPGASGVNGWLDDWRWSNVARYTAPFTPGGPFT